MSWSKEQLCDSVLSRVIEWKEKSKKPIRRQIGSEESDVRKWLNDWENSREYRESVLVVASGYSEVALRGLHDDSGHQGGDKTMYLVKSRF